MNSTRTTGRLACLAVACLLAASPLVAQAGKNITADDRSCGFTLHERLRHLQLQGRFQPFLSVTRTEEGREYVRGLQLLGERKSGVRYPEIPGTHQLSLARAATLDPNWRAVETLSVGLTDPMIEEARRIGAFDDYKPLSDARPRRLPASIRAQLRKRAEKARGEAIHQSKAKGQTAAALEGRRAYLRTFIEGAYDLDPELEAVQGLVPPKWRLESPIRPDLQAAFRYTEETWAKLTRRTPANPGSSLLQSPYPILVPAGRFQEAYYWDTYFGMQGLLATDRLELAQMQVENLLEYVRRYGLVPNGGRDYYLSRSQPPFLSSMVREVFEESMKRAKAAGDLEEQARLKLWLRERALPLLRRDYEGFWMKERVEPRTGLNFHSDDIDLPRPERHSADNDYELGATCRDTRAMAESGLDFTELLGRCAGSVSGVLLNSMLYKTEMDLEWASKLVGNTEDAGRFEAAATRRKQAMDKHLWNEAEGRYENFNLKTNERNQGLTADTFVPLFVGMVEPERAARIHSNLRHLEKDGGIMSSGLVDSKHQWDGNNGWAPHQHMAVNGLIRYGYRDDAHRIAGKYVDTIAQVREKHGAMYERVDVETRDPPREDGEKYPTQEGFLWTNGVWVDFAVRVLGMNMVSAR